MKTRSKIIELVKSGQSDKSTSATQIDRMVKKCIGNTLHKQGWGCHPTEINHLADSTLAKIRVFKKQKRERDTSDGVFNKQLEDILQKLSMMSRSQGWKFRDTAIDNKVAPKQNFEFPLPEEIQSYFSHIYDRDAQIRIIYSSLNAAKASEFEVRNSCLLFGEPGGGKTETLLAFEKMVGPQNVIKLSAPDMTKAGLDDLILDFDVVPPIIMIEELEKCNPLNLPTLLSILDNRGEIVKTNARIGHVRKEAKCLCLSTVNDLNLLKGIFSGALFSRFSHKIYFNKCGREVLTKILEREIIKIKGDNTWINPLLDYVLNVEKNSDPRRAIALLDGKSKWLTGEYLKDLMAIRQTMEQDGVSI